MKDCFGLHGHSAFGSVAKEKSGVGQQPAASVSQLTELVHWLQAGKTVDISRCASESTDLLPPSALLRPHSRPAAFPPSRPAAGRLPAAAGHRAAVVFIDASAGDTSGGSSNQQQCQRECSYLPIGVIAIYRDKSQYRHSTIYGCYSAIGSFETFDYSRLRRNFAFYQREGQCKASVVHSHSGLNHLCCGSRGRKADSSGLCTGKPAQKPCWGYYAPRCRQSRHRRAGKNGIRYAVSSRASPSAHCILFCPPPHRGDERPGTYLRITGSAKNPRHNIIKIV